MFSDYHDEDWFDAAAGAHGILEEVGTVKTFRINFDI